MYREMSSISERIGAMTSEHKNFVPVNVPVHEQRLLIVPIVRLHVRLVSLSPSLVHLYRIYLFTQFNNFHTLYDDVKFKGHGCHYFN